MIQPKARGYHQRPKARAERETVQEACRYMWERRTGSVLALDDQQLLTGIFTGEAARATSFWPLMIDVGRVARLLRHICNRATSSDYHSNSLIFS